jgi:SAM-dependent methyltransferase
LDSDVTVQHVHQPEPHRHGDLLQGLPGADDQRRTDPVESLRIRAGDHREDGAQAHACTSVDFAATSYLEGKKIGWKTVWRQCSRSSIAIVSDLGENEAAHHPAAHGLARCYNAWLWDKVEPFVGGRVLEVGAGIGNMTQRICAQTDVVATETNPEYLKVLRSSFEGHSRVQVNELDLSRDLPAEVGSGFDTILCLNVLEHIEDDIAALRRMYDVLVPGGRLILIVPAFNSLYGEIDRGVGHFRRYDRTDIVARLEQAGFAVDHASVFNLIGALGWYVNSRLLKRNTVPGVQSRLYDKLVPVFRLEERFEPSVGLSLLAVGRRPVEA